MLYIRNEKFGQKYTKIYICLNYLVKSLPQMTNKFILFLFNKTHIKVHKMIIKLYNF